MVIRKIGEKCDAFISWNNKDENILKQIVNENRMLNVDDSSITVWDSNGSGAFGSLDEIKYQIDLCETFIVIVSKNSIKSQWVYDEFMHAYEKIGINRILPKMILTANLILKALYGRLCLNSKIMIYLNLISML